jgi:acyl-coenzyme A thioesterase PaaI-like protein
MDIQNPMCFACGSDNPIGLHLQFQDDAWAAQTEFMPTPEYQGYAGILHGGLISTLLDEVMARPLVMQGIRAVTAKMEVRFRKAAPIGTKLVARAELTGQRGRIYEMKAVLSTGDGDPIAEATATFMAVK